MAALPVFAAGNGGNRSRSVAHPGEHEGDVVLAVLPQRLGHAFTGAAEGRAGTGQGGTEFALQRGQPVVQRPGAALDQAVGVQGEGGTGRQADLGGLKAVIAKAKRQPGP